MSREVIMPALGMAQESGLLVAWRKQPGEAVSAGDVVMEVETDKSTMEVEASESGFLTNVRAREGEDVPVGRVVAFIAKTAEEAESAAAASEDDAPDRADGEGGDNTSPASSESPAAIDGVNVIMPALGMSQDTGRIVAWLKKPGEAVMKGEPLFELETDKSTVEVEAQADGFLAAVYAEVNEDVPVGELVAVISAEKPAEPITAKPQPKAAKAVEPAPEASRPAKARAAGAEPSGGSGAAPKPVPSPGGRILASPKAKRLAAERGIDLERLAAAGLGQPFHVADLDRPEARNALAQDSGSADAATASAAGISAKPSVETCRIEAAVSRAGFDAFLDWAQGEASPPVSASTVLLALAAGALREATGSEMVVIGLDTLAPGGDRKVYEHPDLAGLGENSLRESEASPALVLRDLTASRITGLRLPAGEVPVLSVAMRDGDFILTFEFGAAAMAPDMALAFVEALALRLGDPLRQLL